MGDNKVQASPSARRLAKELGVELEEVAKTVGDRRIQAEDVERYYYETPVENADIKEEISEEVFTFEEIEPAESNERAHDDNNTVSEEASVWEEPAETASEELSEDMEALKSDAEYISKDTAAAAEEPEHTAASSSEAVPEEAEIVSEEEPSDEKQEASEIIYEEAAMKEEITEDAREDLSAEEAYIDEKTEEEPENKESEPALEFAEKIEQIVRRELSAIKLSEEAAVRQLLERANMPAADVTDEAESLSEEESLVSLGELYARHINEENSKEEQKRQAGLGGAISTSLCISKCALEDAFFKRHIGYDKGLCETFVTACGSALRESARELFGKVNVIMVSKDARFIKRSVDLGVFGEAGSLRYDAYDATRRINIWILDNCALSSFSSNNGDTLDIFISSNAGADVRCDISCATDIMDMARLIRFAVKYRACIEELL